MKAFRLVLAAVAAFLCCTFAIAGSFSDLTAGQRNTLRTAILTEPSLAAAIAVRNDAAITAWCNEASTTDAWMDAAESRTLFEAMDLTKYDALTAGKRMAWDLMLRYAPLDMGRNKLRSAIVDVWGATDSVPVLQALREKATRAQAAVGGASKTTNTVTGLHRILSEPVSVSDISILLNN